MVDDTYTGQARVTAEPGAPRADLERLAREVETAPASRIIARAVEELGGDLVVACSFQDCVIVDLAVRTEPAIEVVFLDTGFHFPETLDYVEVVRKRYDLNLTVLRPEVDETTWPCGTERCCEVRKVEPLRRALEGRSGWVTGLKRADNALRKDIPVVGWDGANGIVKVNPLALWTDDDVDSYAADHGLPVHPLIEEGYLSIGCAPATEPVAPGEHPRSGRWRGSGKTECGLHPGG